MPRAAVRLLHAGLPHHDHRLPRREPGADRGRGAGGDRRQPLPLHRLPEHRRRRAARRRDRPRADRAADDDASCSASRSSGARTPGWSPAAAATSTTSGTARSRPRSCAARTRTPGSSTSTPAAPGGRRPGRDLHLRGPRGADETEGSAVAEPLPLLIPHPSLHRAAHRLPAGPRRGQPRRRGRRHGRRPRPLPRRGRRRAGPGHLRRPAAVVGVDNARRADRTRARRRPGQRRGAQPGGGRRRRRRDGRRAAHAVARASTSSAAPRCRWRARGCTPGGTPTTGRCGCYSSTQTSTSVRAAVAAKLGLPLDKVECIAPIVGGGFGVKIVHPWPEEVLVPWAARRLDAEVKWVEDRREHFVSSAHERGQLQEITVGFDDDGRLLALDVQFWHDNGAYTPYGIIVPIITSTQLLGPYKPGTYRVRVVVALHEHRDRHAVPRRRPAAGRASRWSGRWTRSPTSSASTAPRCAAAQLHPARRDALRPPPDRSRTAGR